MINYLQPMTWEAPVSPECDKFEEDKKNFILSRIEDLAEAITRHGIDSPKLDKGDNDLIDTLYEYIEESSTHFSQEVLYDV